MYKYKVETYKVNDAAEAMNALAAQGWRVIAVSPNVAFGFGIVATYEKKTDNRKLQLKEQIKRAKVKKLLLF